jgi:hypothetical protein
VSENILARINGEELGRAVLKLPDVTAHEAETVVAEFNAANVGKVRVLFRKFHHKRGRSSHTFWLAARAERIE